MSEIFILVAATLSLLLTVVYGFAKNQKRLESELQSARRIKTLVGLRIANMSSLEDVLNEILTTLARVYRAKEGTLEFHGEFFAGFSLKIDDENKLPSNFVHRIEDGLSNMGETRTETGADGKDRHVTFTVDDRDFSCRVELHTNILLIHNEYWHIQELLREKISHCLLDKIDHAVKIALKNSEIPCAVLNGLGKGVYKNSAFLRDFHGAEERELERFLCEMQKSNKDHSIFALEKNSRKIVVKKIDENLFTVFSPPVVSGVVSSSAAEVEGLLYQALDDLSLGVVVLDKDERKQNSEFKITSISKAFYRIFGLEGSNAQSEEIDEILSTAVRPDEMKKSSAGMSHAGDDFFYMRRDGLKVRARLTFIKGAGESRIIIFEPVENNQLLVSSYRQLLNAAENLFRTGDVRFYLKEIRDATLSDGIALVKKISESRPFELTEKVGFIINVPQILLEDPQNRDLINSQGYVVIPLRERNVVTGALIALKPNEDAIEIALAGARILEAQNLIQGEIHGLHFQNAKLLTDAKRADAANRSKSDFLANMSHEIRTPLNSIIGFADIIHSESSELSRDLLGEFSENIVVAGRHLLTLINDILDLTKVETGRMKLDLQEFSMNEVVESVQRILNPLLGKKWVQLDVHIENGLDVFTADTVKFKQILYNLLNNAIAYSPVRSTVRLEVVKSADGIELKVIDKGPGIRKEDLDKLFKPFVQLDGREGGAGLGLALTKKLVELHGGAIWMDSTYGSGTTVVVYMPAFPFATIDEAMQSAAAGSEEDIFFVTDDGPLFDLFATVVDGIGIKLTKISPQAVIGGTLCGDEGGVLVVDASLGNLNENVISACRDAGKALLLTEPENVKVVSELLKGFEGKVCFINRKNFTRSELLAELNISSRS